MSLSQPAAFFDEVRRTLLGPTLDASEVNGCNAILAAVDGLPRAHGAYAFATAYLETAHTMQPVLEANWLSKAARERYFFRMYDRAGERPHVAKRLGNTQPGDGVRFAGRGYVQLTGRANYERADAKLGLGGELVRNPDLAMNAEFAARIMRQGMVEGWFTGKSLSSYLPTTSPGLRPAFVQARRIINGVDRAGDVADYALKFQRALELGGWS